MLKQTLNKIIISLILIFTFININFEDKKIITNYKEYFSVPSSCTEANNCEALYLNNDEWFDNWRETDATIMPDGQTRSYANVMFLIDVSLSMQNNKEISYIKQVVKKFTNSLKDYDMMGIANYTPYGTSASNVEYKAHIRKEISKSKNYSDDVFIVGDYSKFHNNAFQYLAGELAKTSMWSYDIIIWLTDSMDDYAFEGTAGGSSLLGYGTKLYIVNIGNEAANINFFGQKTKETLGKYYFIDTTEEVEPTPVTPEVPIEQEPTEEEIIQNCSDAEYREKYPELCKNVVCEGFEDTELGVFLQDIFTYMQIGVVVLLILTGSIDFVKAMSSKDSQQMKKFQNDFIKRLIIGAVIFFVPALVNFLFPLLGIGGSCGIK